MNDHSSKKIIVFPAFYPPHIGGMEFFAHELNLRLARSGQRIVIFAPAFSDMEATRSTESPEGLNIINYPAFEIIPNFPCPKFWRISFWHALRKISACPVDTVVSHTRFFIASFLALCFARIKHIPLIHIEHGSSPVRSQNIFITLVSSLYDRTIGSLVVRGANSVVAVSENVSFFLQKNWGREPVIIRRGFDSADIATIPTSQILPHHQGTIRIMYIGRLISGKGLDTLLAGLEFIPEKNWELVIIGDGPARKSLEEMAKKLKPNKVLFLGEKAHGETIALLKTTDIFINPSRSEGLPTTVAEAALCGKAVVATNVGGTRELFPETNQFFLIPANDPMAVADRVSKLIHNPALITTTGSAAKEFVATEFSWDKPIRHFLDLINEVAR